jgi:hypothetical protein
MSHKEGFSDIAGERPGASLVLMVLLLALALSMGPGLGSANGASILIDAANAVTWGKFTVQDVTADIDAEFFNPALMVEYRVGDGEKLALGAGYSRSGNRFQGEWDGPEGRYTSGEVDVDRTAIDLYLRLLAGPHFNARLGYRNFKYEFTNGSLLKTQHGEPVERADNAVANGKLTKGLDLELNFIGGQNIQFRFAIGFSYFFDAKYDWSYDRTLYDPMREDHNRGKATHNAMALRFKPEFTFPIDERLRLTLDYTLGAGIWEGETTQADIEDYPGVDIFSALGIGLEYLLPLE